MRYNLAMNLPEAEQPSEISLPERHTSRQIFPPPGPEFKIASDALRNILRIQWPVVINEGDSFFRAQAIAATALEFVDITLDGQLPLSDSFEDHELLLTDLEEDIKRRAILAESELKSVTFEETKEQLEQQKALAQLKFGGKQIFAARMQAATAIWHTTSRDWRNKNRYLKNIKSLQPELQLLILTAQNYLVWTTFSGRRVYTGEDSPNIWERLIEMYQKGIYSYHINPETNEFSFTLMQQRDGEPRRLVDYTINYPGAFNPEVFDL